MDPERYVLITSVGLTPANKARIIAALAPVPLAQGDVVGASNIVGLLRDHPTIEKVNFKLWLTSTAVLQRVLHNTDHLMARVGKKDTGPDLLSNDLCRARNPESGRCSRRSASAASDWAPCR